MVVSLLASMFTWTTSFANDVDERPVQFVDLNYTRDVFVCEYERYSTEKYGVNGSNFVALVEDSFYTKSVFDFDPTSRILTFDNIPYKLGPIGSPGNPSDSKNAVKGKDFSGNSIVIDVEDGNYSSVSFLANADRSGTSETVEISITYKGESTPVIAGINRILSFRIKEADWPPAGGLLEGEKYIGQLGAVQNIVPEGAEEPYKYKVDYTGRLYSYTIPIDPEKILDKITIKGERAVIFAVTTVGLNLNEIAQNIGKLIDDIPEPAKITIEHRELIKSIRKVIEDAKKERGLTENLIAPEKLAKLKDAEKRIPYDYQVELDYTRDVFIIDGEQPDKPMFNSSGDHIGMDETELKKLPNFNNNILTFDGVEYKFGPLSKDGEYSNAPNAVHGADGLPIEIDLDNRMYSKIRFIANNNSSSGGDADLDVTTKILYIDGTADTIPMKIGSFRYTSTYEPTDDDNYEKHFVAKTKAIRPSPSGSYPGYYYAYYMTPDPDKIVDKITIDSGKVVVFAVTTTGFSVIEMIDKIENLIEELPDAGDITNEQRELVEIIRSEIDIMKKVGLEESEISNIAKFHAVEDQFEPIKWEEYTVKDSEGNDVEDLSAVANQPITVTAKIKNNSISPNQDYVIIMGLYSENNRLEKVIIISGTVAEGQTAQAIEAFNVPAEATSQWKVRCFVWNSMDHMELLLQSK